jgi:hypothetical protein
MAKPLVYLAFANQPKSELTEGPLPALRQETQGLKDAFLPFAVNDSIGWITDEEATTATLAKALPNLSTSKERPKIIHFSGHAGGDYWKLADGKLADNQLNNLFFGLENVALVFMNACCTEPLRNYLLDELNVKAVIATSKNIGDNQAMEFAISFYTNLIIQGATLEEAFKHACGSVKTFTFDTENFVDNDTKRGGIRRKGSVDNEFPWGIYWKDETAKKWVFNTNLKKDIPKDLENQWKEYADKRQKIAEKEAEIQNIRGILVAQNTPEMTIKLALASMFDLLKKLYDEADVMRKSFENVDRGTMLKGRIDQFNFKSEYDAIRKKHPNLPTGAYILRGHEGSGLGFFSKKIVTLLGRISDFYYPIRIDLGGLSVAKETIFKQLKSGLKLDKNAATTLSTLALAFRETILAASRNERFVLILDNIQDLPDEELRIVLADFWGSLHADLVKNPINRNVIVLLLARLKKIDPDFEEIRDLTTALPTNLPADCIVYLADEVAPLTPQYLSEWCDAHGDVFNEWTAEAQQFYDANEPSVLRTLLLMAEKMNSTDLGNYIHQQEKLTFCKTL